LICFKDIEGSVTKNEAADNFMKKRMDLIDEMDESFEFVKNSISDIGSWL
jgi:hypothetical protein